MEVTVGVFLALFIAAFICEFIDASLGMGYGTILSPILIMVGFEPHIAVPAILISQAIGGYTASVYHQRFRNADFSKDSVDTKVVFLVSTLGIITTILAATLALHLSVFVVKVYIGILVSVMGVIMLSGFSFKFTWHRMVIISVLSAFNKGVSGGGFGPVVTAGQILGGREHKEAVAVTTLAEAPVCTVGFLTYLIGRAVNEIEGPVFEQPFSSFLKVLFSPEMFNWELVMALVLGALFVAPFGAFATRVIKTKRLSLTLGVVVTLLGLLTLFKALS